ncbi:hypothetical protein [Paractinoplanes toevensis]|uniref:Uncharacterized protein n=1 Tax=Paractinoplanes toevensis TaxID=571911 RepID=A0A919TEZ7_9ACTN|nr:hypothetical protein [Actinoplanes toevensis]GIM94403.1 hypothetical protein Ato02nite_061960 [Actinoplanes toevensis]
MSEKREYPPAPIVHHPRCTHVRDRQFPLAATLDIALEHPNGRRHDGFQPHQHSVGVVEQVQYLPHEYAESDQTFPDAVRPMCLHCGGTHGVLDALVLPPGARVVDPP